MTIKDEMKILSYVVYLDNLRKVNPDELENIKLLSANYIKSNEVDLALLNDIFKVNFVNRHSLVIYYLMRNDIKVRDARITVNESYRDNCSRFKWYNKVATDEFKKEMLNALDGTEFKDDEDVDKLIKRSEIFMCMFNPNINCTLEEYQKELIEITVDHYNALKSYLFYLKYHTASNPVKSPTLTKAIWESFTNKTTPNKSVELQRLKGIRENLKKDIDELGQGGVV